MTELNLRRVNSNLPRGSQEDLSFLTVEQLCERLNEKGLPTTGKKKVLLEWLVNAQYVLQSNVDVKPELQESSNFTEVSKESPRLVNYELAQEISSIRRKAIHCKWI